MSVTPYSRNPGPGAERYDTHVPNRFVPENRFLAALAEAAALPGFERTRPLLPEPIWEGHAEAVACYWRAWELAFGNLKQSTRENGFCSNYCDTAFNGNLFMWDSAFVTAFGLYGRRAFDFQKTLDNFYRKQHPDGFICRELSEADGLDCFPRFDPSSTGPNVLAWAEWNHYVKTGDRARLEAVFAPLVAYHQWTRTYRTWPDGSYWTTGWGCGMDNLPRVSAGDDVSWSHSRRTWVDATLQARLSARILLQVAALLGRQAEATDLEQELERLGDYANRALWNPATSFYHDRLPDGTHAPVKHIGAYWALLAGCVPPDRLTPAEFKRLHRVPALSADDPAFSPTGGYWCGGVWAPTNYMVLKGLEETGQHELAHVIARNHLDNVVKVYAADEARWDGAEQFRQFFQLAEFKYDDHRTLWENYAPDAARPGSHSKPGYVGWTGLPPVAVLFEDVLGLTPDAASGRLTWRVRLLEGHGVRRYPFGSHGLLDVQCKARNSRRERPSIEIHSNVPLTLEVIWEGGTDTLKIEKES